MSLSGEDSHGWMSLSGEDSHGWMSLSGEDSHGWMSLSGEDSHDGWPRWPQHINHDALFVQFLCGER
ncbi:Uncharacterised protein [Mycobacteroides abscessus]|nr:Uncharacterised protein [Mycobacteroides abscessus]SKG06545.1 Uncharacterised protein [Mycobacteroides abscessus subsp. massiliense]CPY98447.1 Uncharacterised protein [Mycobacteroides abscessus]SKW04207.1 Uncharacterised protein [Mycobacteroides abscessus subsp. massiliense]SLD03869.1 Uncharacterised protein [Mycobacteroides abscessus subsp. massiliense]